MSTDPARCAARRALLAAALAASACLPSHTGHSVLDICRGKDVGEELALALDSLGSGAPGTLHRLQGQRFHVSLTLVNPLTPAQCQDRSGTAYLSVDDLPDALAAATSGKKGGQWSIQGTRVSVNLNPGVMDNNLELDLPLDGKPGTWSLSTFAGRVAWGRLLPVGG
ncbi:MAG TPA: hypothetical protein VFS44_00810 [Gemmatimonadaceae bacterium]|nr:hypothetical protein [Gemmatimonadaceae bacterium]